MKVKGVIYIAGAITAKTEYGVYLNCRIAERHAVKLFKQGWFVFCPHKNQENFRGLFSDDPEMDARYWYEFDLAMLSRCDAIYLLPGWQRSRGAVIEYDFATREGIPIMYGYEEDELEEEAGTRAERYKG